MRYQPVVLVFRRFAKKQTCSLQLGHIFPARKHEAKVRMERPQQIQAACTYHFPNFEIWKRKRLLNLRAIASWNGQLKRCWSSHLESNLSRWTDCSKKIPETRRLHYFHPWFRSWIQLLLDIHLSSTLLPLFFSFLAFLILRLGMVGIMWDFHHLDLNSQADPQGFSMVDLRGTTATYSLLPLPIRSMLPRGCRVSSLRDWSKSTFILIFFSTRAFVVRSAWDERSVHFRPWNVEMIFVV